MPGMGHHHVSQEQVIISDQTLPNKLYHPYSNTTQYRIPQ